MVESEVRIMVKHCIKCELHGHYEEYSNGHKNSCLHRLCSCVFCQNHDRILVLLCKVRSRRRDVRRQWWMWRWEESLFCLAQVIMTKIWEETLFLQAQDIMKEIQVAMNGSSEIENLFPSNNFNIKKEPIDSDNSDVGVDVTVVVHDSHNSSLSQESPHLSLPTPRIEEGILNQENVPGVEFKYLEHYENSVDDMMKAKYCVKCELHGYYEEYKNGHKNSCIYRLCPCEGCQDHDEMLDLLRMERSMRREVKERWWRWQDALFLQAQIIMQRTEVELGQDIEIGNQFPVTTIIKEEPMDSNNNYADSERDTVSTEEDSSIFHLPTPPGNNHADEEGHAKEISRDKTGNEAEMTCHLINSDAPPCSTVRCSSPTSVSEETGKKGDIDLPQCNVELPEQVKTTHVTSIDVRQEKPDRKSIDEEEDEEKNIYEKVKICQRSQSNRDIPSSQEDMLPAKSVPPIVKENYRKAACVDSILIQVNKNETVKNKAFAEGEERKQKEGRNDQSEHRIDKNQCNQNHQSREGDKDKEKHIVRGGHAAQGGENKVKRIFKKASSLIGTVRAHGNVFGPKCFKCGKVCKNLSNLKNHVLSYYYQVFFDVLPDREPYLCPHPECNNRPPSRDRITLVRHFAFYHRKLFEMTEVTPEDFKITGIQNVSGRPLAKMKEKSIYRRLLKKSSDDDMKTGNDRRREGEDTKLKDLQHNKENIEKDKYRDMKGKEDISGRGAHQSSLFKQITPEPSIPKPVDPNVVVPSCSGGKLMKHDKLYMNIVEKFEGGETSIGNKRARIDVAGNSSSTKIYSDSFLEDFFIHNKVSEVPCPLQEVRVDKDVGNKAKTQSSSKRREAMEVGQSNMNQKVTVDGIMYHNVKL